ncbi:thermosome subunit alpha [Candidatus Nitrosotenuis sp. DW1]|uniref:thermosome subunit alpha n=1 Tax=Candidatus Nitrosotenuis sp. DW1 TaxID=2259672 RepID=UPI0015C7CC83|nr:thermosome subunit alpha [Candidatus Nitrosotenuis sp. DW1]QLH09632.1 thermosome subunit [Candidatus Nitrosotenuis sp. DW1]
MKYPELLSHDVARVGIEESRKLNLVVGGMITDVIKTSLGPRGMEKVFIDILGEDTITKHGGAFLRKVDVKHPVAKAIIEGVNTVDTHVGDGTISAAILIGMLLSKSQELLKMEISPTTIIKGYEKSLEFALDILDEIKKKESTANKKVMYRLATSCLAGKAMTSLISEDISIANLIVDAVCSVANFQKKEIDIDDIKIEEKAGNANNIQLVRGTVVDKTIDNSAMPRSIENAKILLLNEPLEMMRTKTDEQIEINSPEQMTLFLNQETIDIRAKVKKIVNSGANVVISRKGINSIAQEYLSKEGIISMRRVKMNDLSWLEKSTGAKTCKSLEDISEDELGFAKKVYEKNIGGDKMVFIEGCNNPKSVTILLRCNSKRYLDEFHRDALNVIYVLRNFIENSFIVRGGGATEAIIANRIRELSTTVEGREQIVIGKFADAIEEIPITLARNVGMDPIDTLTQLRAKYANCPKDTLKWYGIDSEKRKVSEIFPDGVIEPLVVKQQIVKTGVAVTNMILNVNDIFMKDEIDNTHCHIDGTVHAHHDGGKAHNHFEQEGLEQRQMHHYY